jgi:carboxymethylenebutenolidase
MSETARLHAADGHEFDAYVAKPEATPRAALVVIQEVFGVNHHIRAIADRFAREGYLAVAPALFDRYQRGFEAGYDAQGMETGSAIAKQINMDWAAADTLAAVGYARDEYKTEVGIVGYCFGGSVAWMAAASMPVSAAVGYYGGYIASFKDMKLKAPVMLHFGAHDDHIPMSDVDAIKAAHPEVPVYTYDAGHGFNCDERASYNEAAATEAGERTLAFFKEHLSDRLDNTGKSQP